VPELLLVGHIPIYEEATLFAYVHPRENAEPENWHNRTLQPTLSLDVAVFETTRGTKFTYRVTIDPGLVVGCRLLGIET
jgi:hypothetical protein